MSASPNTPGPSDTQPKLEGWKAIADFLEVSERTARSWEREKGLPVHRFADSDKSRVWAMQWELQSWLTKRDTGPGTRSTTGLGESASTLPEATILESESIAPPPTAAEAPQVLTLNIRSLTIPSQRSERSYENRVRIVVGLAAVGIALLLLWSWRGEHRTLRVARLNPHHLKVEGQTLIALSSEEREVWRFPLPSPVGPLDQPGSSPWAVADVNGDGFNEVLCSFKKPNENSFLLCIGSSGKVLWTRESGTPWPRFGGKEPARKEHQLNLLGVLKRARPDGGRIVVGSHSLNGFGMQVALLRADGTLVAQYLHGGWLISMTLADLDSDGEEQLIFGGVNESFGQYDEKRYRWNDPKNGAFGSTLVVLSPLFKSSQGRTRNANDLWTYDAFPQGGERAVLLFRNPIRPMLDAKFFVRSLSTVNGEINADVGSGIGGMVHYVLSSKLAFISANPAPLASEEGFAELLNPPRELSRRYEALQQLYATNIRRLGPDVGVSKH
jgi:hypothetical protein